MQTIKVYFQKKVHKQYNVVILTRYKSMTNYFEEEELPLLLGGLSTSKSEFGGLSITICRLSDTGSRCKIQGKIILYPSKSAIMIIIRNTVRIMTRNCHWMGTLLRRCWRPSPKP